METSDGHVQSAVVLDANVLRNESIVNACIERFERTDEPIVIPEMALFELTKHPEQWEYTLRRSLILVARCPRAVVLARSSKPLGLAEEATGVSTRSVIDVERTKAFRAILKDVELQDGPQLQSMLNAIRQFRSLFQHDGHVGDSLAVMQTLKASAASSFPHELVKRIGNDLEKKDRASFREFVQNSLRFEMLRDAHVRRGVEAKFANALMEAPSVTYLYALAIGLLGLGWTFTGGIDTASPNRTSNDALDIEYMIPALWAGRLISADVGARTRFDDFKALGATWWPHHREWFDSAVAMGPDDALSWLRGT